jgi:activating signal cointegrator 1
MPLKIPCISLWQPYASLMAWGFKRIETRHWAWPGDLPAFLAIHAAKKWDGELAAMCRTPQFAECLEKMGVIWTSGRHSGGFCSVRHWAKLQRPSLPFGAVVAVVRLVECVSTGMVRAAFDNGISTFAARALADPSRAEAHFGNYESGRYCWTTDRVFRLPTPISERGCQSIWKWEPPAEAAAWIEEQTAALAAGGTID